LRGIFAAQRPGLVLHIHPKHRAEHEHAEDNAHNTERIGHRIAERGERSAITHHSQAFERLLSRTESWRIGGASSKETCRRRDIDSSPRNRCHRQGGPEQDDRHGQQVQDKPLLFQGSQKSHPDLHADAINKEHQAKIPHQIKHSRLYAEAEMPK